MKPQQVLLFALSLTSAGLVAPSAHADAPAAKPVPVVKAATPAKSADAGDKTFPAQSSVAAKTAFGTVAASEKAVAQALDAKALAEALKLVGKPGAFQGTVSQVYSPRNHSLAILDFAPNYHDAVTATVKPGTYAKFPDLSLLVGKRVLVSGKFSANSHGVAQIELAGPDQLKVIK